MKKLLLFITIFLFFINLNSCIEVAVTTTTKKVISKSEYLNKTYYALKNALPEAQVTIVNDSIKIIFNGGLLFKPGEDKLGSNTDDLFKRFANVLNIYTKTNLLITGHTDNVGNVNENLKLSENRANSSKEKLIVNSVNSDRIESWGMGQANPIDNNDTEEGRKNNRRVEFIVLYRYN